MMLKFENDDVKEKWGIAIKFSKLIHNSKDKKFLFMPEQAHEENEGLP